MVITITVLISVLLIGTISSTIIYLLKYKKILSELNSYFDSGRLGYYEFTINGYYTQKVCYVYVTLIEEYANGMCKVKIKKVEYVKGYSSNADETIQAARRKFQPLLKMIDIEWLDAPLKDIRRKKLEEIKENLK
jgi:hypothetical protein